MRNHLELHFRNDGAEPATSVLLCDRRLHRAAFLELHGGPADVPKLKWRDEAEAPKGAPEGVACRRFELAEPLAPGAAVELHAFAALTHVLRPEPAEVGHCDCCFSGASAVATAVDRCW